MKSNNKFQVTALPPVIRHAEIMKILIIMLFFPSAVFAGPGRMEMREKTAFGTYEKYINGKPQRIEDSGSHRSTEYDYLDNGLIILTSKIYDSGGMDRVLREEYKFLLYNEYYNENVISANKINETMFIAQIKEDAYSAGYTITAQDNVITVVSTHENRNFWTAVETTALTFCETSKRLNHFTTVRRHTDYGGWRSAGNTEVYETVTKNYEFEYDSNDRLIAVYSIYNNESICVKQYYYDGQIREFQKPFYHDFEAPALEEIVIYNNDLLRYYIRLSSFPRQFGPRNVEERNELAYYVLFEFDENRNEIRQIKYYGSSIYRDQDSQEIVEYNIQNSILDNKRNWLETIAVNLNNGERQTIRRRIEY
jgi:hypothetical protein